MATATVNYASNRNVLNFPPSMDLSSGRPPAIPDSHTVYAKHESQNASYTQGSTVRIVIPTSQNSWLFPQDSYISFKASTVFGGNTNGVLSLDQSAYSYYKSIRITHGSNQLVYLTECGRVWNMMQCLNSNMGATASEISLGTGAYMQGHTVTSGSVNDYSFCLPCPILGLLSDSALPLGELGSSDLVLELQINDANQIFTTRTHNDVGAEDVAIGINGAMIGQAGTATAAPTITSVTLSEIHYYAKIAKLSPMYNQVLREAFSGCILVSGTDHRLEMKQAGGTAFSDKHGFNFSSLKALYWWLTNTDTANGIVAAHNLANGTSQRMSGPLRDYSLVVDGETLPPYLVRAEKAGLVSQTANTQFCSAAFQELLRCVNRNGNIEPGVCVTRATYGNSLTTVASDQNSRKAFIGSISLDRFDASDQRSLQGLNIMNSNIQLNIH